MSSKPSMMRSSRGVRVAVLSVGTSTLSASSRSSSFISAICGFPLRRFGLGAVACQCCYAFSQAFFPGIGRVDVGQAAALVLELKGTLGQLSRLIFGDAHLLGGNAGLNLAQR